jgi:glycosyltransferase involved in cell wall biosynthesis
MERQKNHERVISIFKELLRDNADARLLLVGEGGNEVERLVLGRIAELGVASRVIRAGIRRDVPRLLRSADLMIFPSLWEGLPGAVLEACAAGLPVIASDLPGVQEIAACFPFVQCMPPSSSDSEWAQSAQSLLRKLSSGKAVQESCSLFSRSPFSIDTCADSHLAIWRRAAESDWPVRAVAGVRP